MKCPPSQYFMICSKTEFRKHVATNLDVEAAERVNGMYQFVWLKLLDLIYV